jgi:Transposase, Mutator family
VLSGFVRGLSVRDVEAALAEALGPEAALSKSTVSRVCEVIKTEFDAWKLRDLGGIELEYLYLDGSHFRMHPGARAEPVLCAWGITTQGSPVLVGLAPGAHEGHDPWASFLGELTDRGLRAPLLVITDGAAGLIGAVEVVFAHSLRQRCLVHRSRKESTWWCIGVGWCCGEEVGCAAVAGGCRDGRVAFLPEEGSGLADDVADGGPAHVAESIGEDVQGAQVSLVEDGEQDTLAVADLLRKHPVAGTRLAWTATTLMVEAVRLGRLPHGESLGQHV